MSRWVAPAKGTATPARRKATYGVFSSGSFYSTMGMKTPKNTTKWIDAKKRFPNLSHDMQMMLNHRKPSDEELIGVWAMGVDLCLNVYEGDIATFERKLATRFMLATSTDTYAKMDHDKRMDEILHFLTLSNAHRTIFQLIASKAM